MKNRTLLIVAVCLMPASGILVWAGENPQAEVAEQKLRLAKIKMLESSLRVKGMQIEKLKADNARLIEEVRLLRKLCQANGLNSNVRAADQTKSSTGGKPSTRPATTTQKGVELTPGPSITIWGPNLSRWQGDYVTFWKRYKEAKESNPIRAKRQYDGARVTVAGKISSISTYHGGTAAVTLGTGMRAAIISGGRTDTFIDVEFLPTIQYRQGPDGSPQEVRNKRLADQIDGMNKGDLIVVNGTWSCHYRRVVKCSLVQRRKEVMK